jgi:hypothetical protein
VLAIVGLSGTGALLFSLIFEKAGGLRVSEAEELGGFDESYWDTPNTSEEPLVTGATPTQESPPTGGLSAPSTT